MPEIRECLDREATGFPCSCGGYCDQVEPTTEEDKQHGCGRLGCCSRAFVCRICGKRWTGSAESPELGY